MSTTTPRSSIAYLKGAIYFFEVKNLLDKTYIASANNITDSINATTGLQNPGTVLANTGTGSIYAGAPRTFVGGMSWHSASSAGKGENMKTLAHGVAPLIRSLRIAQQVTNMPLPGGPRATWAAGRCSAASSRLGEPVRR